MPLVEVLSISLQLQYQQPYSIPHHPHHTGDGSTYQFFRFQYIFENVT